MSVDRQEPSVNRVNSDACFDSIRACGHREVMKRPAMHADLHELNGADSWVSLRCSGSF